VEVVARRSRELGHDGRYRGRFAALTARAVAPAERLIRDCRLLLAPGGQAIFYKTPPSVAAELPLARREADKHGLTVSVSEVVELPLGAGKRQFIGVAAPPRG
jgi:16S rRNA G527 N7-methylase RsmG